MTIKQRYEGIISWFKENMPSAETELIYDTPFHLLLSVILSAQCTDKRVNMISPALFKAFPSNMLQSVTTCHTKTRDLAAVCRDSEIVIAAAGKAKVIGKEHFSEGQVVIDVGIHANEDGSLCGDVDTDSALDIVSAITPVPGGVGAVTTSVLIDHVVTAAEKITKENEK